MIIVIGVDPVTALLANVEALADLILFEFIFELFEVVQPRLHACLEPPRRLRAHA
jgi:hypothetical protein